MKTPKEKPMYERQRRSAPILALCAVALAVGCGKGFRPEPLSAVPFLDRAQVQEEGGVRVTAAVPDAKETQLLFGSRLYRRGVQPVWIEIENALEETIWFLPVGLDSEYFTPIEAANMNLVDLADADPKRNAYFFDNSISLFVQPGQKRAGFVFTRLDEGTKTFNVDVSTEAGNIAMTFFIEVPGLKIDHRSVDWENLYADGFTELGFEELLEGLETDAPATVTDKKGEGKGDPLNLVVVGEPEEVYYAFLRAGWDETETIHRASLWKTAMSFISGGEYRYSPVSALFVFGRGQDVAFQWARDNIHERNHLRLWMSSYTLNGTPVWLGQISRDIGVRFTSKTITTHKIDANVDETREYLLENLAYAQALEKFAYAGGVGEAPYDAPRGNLTGDPYFTDGYRLVLWVTSRPTAIDDIGYEDWRTPPYLRGQ